MVFYLGTLCTPLEWLAICCGRTKNLSTSKNLWIYPKRVFLSHSPLSSSKAAPRLVDLLSNPDLTPNAYNAKRRLLEYYSLLESARLTNSVLSSLPLPRTLDPNQPVPLPSRLYTLMILLKDTLALAIRLPFFLFPVIVHLPVYILSRLGAQLAADEVETQAQNKVAVGLVLLVLFIYPTAFFLLWAFMMYTPLGALVSAGIVWLLAVYHNTLILGAFPPPAEFTALTNGNDRSLRTSQTFARCLASVSRCLDS